VNWLYEEEGVKRVRPVLDDQPNASFELTREGNAEFIVGKACPKLLIPTWQMRWTHLNKLTEKSIAKYAEISKKVDAASAAVLVSGWCNENKIKPTIDVAAKKLAYPLRRISRLRQPRASALLARYANFVAREAFDHDFGTPPEEPSTGAVAQSGAVAKSDSAKHDPDETTV
jgi:hypothetical protein